MEQPRSSKEESMGRILASLPPSHSPGSQKNLASARPHYQTAALGQLGLIERNDLATMAIAKVIIGLAKEGERDAGGLCALALKRISK
jgi:hypothetical protein